MAMDTNEIMMRTLERIGLELQGLREDVKAQAARLEVQDQRATAIEDSLGRLHTRLEALARPYREADAQLGRLHREVFAMSSTFTIMSDRLAFAALEEAEHSRHIGERLERIDRRLERLGESMQRLDGRMGAIERGG